ncbi:uroporphyrinogen decarboxylase [Kocuria marina]|uniref:uroporphyrinogen decarboxylase n=1 Tax=Kocuria TaxID=57493 RepID=UPI0018744FD4|nr:uroporphyrinogen decarboxylase [Kocuria marina]MCT1734430.1 uroporphyrinogen decarboxylase [Kocuria marina]GHD88298.1 uroporphyrinogen decarboxylase [Kocuria marina]
MASQNDRTVESRRAESPHDPAAATEPGGDHAWEQRIAALPTEHPLRSAGVADSPLISTLRGLPAAHTPVWFMRQAGRSLPEYRAAREGTRMLEACLTPDLAAEITLQPVRRHGVDAAIFFSDIVVPMKLASVAVDIVAGRGPVLDHPVRTAADVTALPELPDSALDPIREAVARTVAELGDTPLIGFAGAPFTIAAYAVEGGPSRDHLRPRTMMHADPASWTALAEWAARTSGAFLRAQVEAGASAVQLFDSWAGSLSLADYEAHVQRHSADALAAVADLGVPRIHFGTGTGELLAAMRDAGADAVGVDYRIPLDIASQRLGGRTVVQGNIDPALLAAPREVLHEHARDVLRRGRSAPGHVVNLGHGVPPETDPDVLSELVTFIHKETR